MADQERSEIIPELGPNDPQDRPRGIWATIKTLFRTRIVAGLLTLIPIWVTWVVVKFLFDTMKSVTEPIAWWAARELQTGGPRAVLPYDKRIALEKELIEDVVTGLVSRGAEAPALTPDQESAVDEVVRKLTYVLDQVPRAPAGLIDETYLYWIVPILSVVLTLFLLYFLGLLTATVFGRRLIMLVEFIVEKLPLVKTVYRSTKQVVMTIGGAQSMNFKRVVLVEFPRPGMKCIAFLTAVMKDADSGRQMATVFIATTPNFTTGYMQIIPLDEVSETNWSVEEAIKVLMSGGILSPPTVRFDEIHAVKWDNSLKAQGDTPVRPMTAKDNEK